MTSVVDIHKVKGKRPEFDIYIGRRVRFTEFKEDSIWANPYPVKKFGRKKALKLYEFLMRGRLSYIEWSGKWKEPLEELRGKRLGCWCITTDKIEPLVCHGQVLMKILREKEK